MSAVQPTVHWDTSAQSKVSLLTKIYYFWAEGIQFGATSRVQNNMFYGPTPLLQYSPPMHIKLINGMRIRFSSIILTHHLLSSRDREANNSHTHHSIIWKRRMALALTIRESEWWSIIITNGMFGLETATTGMCAFRMYPACKVCVKRWLVVTLTLTIAAPCLFNWVLIRDDLNKQHYTCYRCVHTAFVLLLYFAHCLGNLKLPHSTQWCFVCLHVFTSIECGRRCICNLEILDRLIS